jgi:hypothetical protein
MKQYYFEKHDSEVCRSESYLQKEMIEKDLTEMQVYKAKPYKVSGEFWCKKYLYIVDSTEECCGNDCEEYSPRNGKGGCCRLHSNIFFEPGELITLHRKKC